MSKAINIRNLLKRLNKLFEMIVSRELAKIGLTNPQIFVLRQIYEEPKTIGQLSNALDLSYSTVSGIVDRLERDGWIERVRDVSDRRMIWIRKTEKIEEIIHSVPVFQESYYTLLLKDLGIEELDQIERSLCLLVRQLEKKAEGKL